MTRAELKALILSLFEDNITEEISPKDGRDSFDALIDNLLNLEEDYDLLGLKVHTTGRIYQVGDTYYFGQGIYGVTAAHTGGASPDFTKATLIASVNTSAILDYTSGMTVTDGQVCNFFGTLIRVNTGTGTVTSTDPLTDGFWTFLNFKDEDSATVSGAYTYNGQNLNAKNVNIGITGNMTISFARIQKYGLYKITFSNSFAPKTVTFTDLCTNMYTGATITSITIPTGDCVIYIAKAYSGYYHIGGRVMDLTALISNEAYDASWLGNSTQGASKNAIYDKIESVIADYNSRIDAAIEGVKWKTPVQVLSDDNINLLDIQSNIDGEDIFEGDYVALPYQTDPTENGIYILESSGLLVRSPEADTGDELSIAQFTILQGSHANETWGVNNRTINLGVDPVSMSLRNSGTTPEATEFVSGKGKIAQDTQVDAQLTSDPSLPLQSNTWISLRGLKRALNYVVGLFYTKSESDDRYQKRYNPSIFADNGGTGNAFTAMGSPTFVGSLPHFILLTFSQVSGYVPTGAATLNIDGIGATPLVRDDGTALQSGDVIGGFRYACVYSTLVGYRMIGVGVSATGGGAVSSVNTKTGAVTLNQDEILDGATYKQYSQTEKTKLAAVSGSNTGDETTATIKTKLGAANNVVDGYLLASDWSLFDSKQDALTFDSAPTGGSANPVTSDGIYTAINAAIEGTKSKGDVAYATTLNITLSGLQVIDGTLVVAGQRILVKDQTTQSENGIYISAVGAWTRALDANTGTELEGAIVSVDNGATNDGTTWRQTSAPITLGATAVTWVAFSSIVPDATPTTKGKAKLYTALGSNTDGAMDQASVSLLIQYNLMINLINSKV